MNFVHTDELLSLMAEKTDEQEDFRTMHARLDEEIISSISFAGQAGRAQTLKQFENNTQRDEVHAPLHDDLLDPILHAAHSENLQRPRAFASEKRGKKSSIGKNRLSKPSPKPKRYSLKADDRRRRSRRNSKRQEPATSDREKWTGLAQNLLALMGASRRSRTDLDSDQMRRKRSTFRKQVTALLVPFFKKPKEAAVFLATLEARELYSEGQVSSSPEQCKAKQAEGEGSWKKGPGLNLTGKNHSGQSDRCVSKNPVMWSMFSVDWESTRVQRRRVARKRTILKQGQSADGALKENIDAQQINSRSHQPVVPKKNKAVAMRRENERRHWRVLKDEMISIILENIRMMVTLKKLCRPRLLAKLRQEATDLGIVESFNNFANTLPLNTDINSWLGSNDQEPVANADEIVLSFLQSNEKNASENQSAPDNKRSSRNSLESRSETSFSDLSYELQELENVIRSALDDFDPEREDKSYFL